MTPLQLNNLPGRIGVFDSGYGGLTILKDFLKLLPQYDYLYFGDNARAPYGNRSFDIVYEFTSQAVEELFARGCHLVILACNTASAKALRSIQLNVIPEIAPDRRVLGVIRPTVEIIDKVTRSGHIGVLSTPGTARSHSYKMEVEKLFPYMTVTEMGCPMWVPLVENNEAAGNGADYFVKKYIEEILRRDPYIDTLILACTHYPLLIEKIRKHTPKGIHIVEQGGIVAASLEEYLRRHPEIDALCSKGGTTEFLTTESPETFNPLASMFIGETVNASQIIL